MDTISIIVVTAIANALITGIVSNVIFYRYTKRIDETFNQRMKKYETMVSISYAKRVQALDDIKKSFHEYIAFFNRLGQKTIEGWLQPSSFNHDDYRQEIEKLSDLLEKFYYCFEANRAILPLDYPEQIKNIHTRAKRQNESLVAAIATLSNENEEMKLQGVATLSSMCSTIYTLHLELDTLYRRATDVDFSGN